MKIYKVEHDKFEYDSFMGHVIVANSKEEARQIAKIKHADEGTRAWDNAEIEECGEYTGEKTDPFILLSDFHAG